ncbi:MAG TPA: glycosyltransferase family 4 protein [Arthrobacter sp.]|nr:glycosyltransferase family 4 protein [Arthrobacter sp.]
MPRIRLLVPGNIHHHSGGNVYNARLVQGLEALGTDVEVTAVEGSWPEASAHARRRLGSLLGAWEPDAGMQGAGLLGTVTLVDGLIAMGAPDELEHAAKAGLETWVLVHMPAPSRHELEARSLRAATGVLCTSSWARNVLAARHGLRGLRVALPGTDSAPLAGGSAPPHIVTVAALLPNKDQLLVVEALGLLQDLDWTASLVGSDQADSGYTGKVRTAVHANGLDGRIQLTGELTGQPLEGAWQAADLSLLVSRAEAFGMVVTESLARGIPVIVRDGTGAVEALRLGGLGMDGDGAPLPGAKVSFPADDDPANPALLAQILRSWLEDPATRASWRERAASARSRLPGWDRTAAVVLDAMKD